MVEMKNQPPKKKKNKPLFFFPPLCFSKMPLDNTTATTLATLRMESDPELGPVFFSMEDLWERKLWHQLTAVLDDVYSNPRSEPIRLRLFTQFVATFQRKISPLRLVSFGLRAAAQAPSRQEALVFLQNLADSVDSPESWDAHLFATIEIARVNLALNNKPAAKVLLDKAATVVDRHEALDPVINAAYYDVKADYFKANTDFTAYYRTALLYLACINVDTDLTPLARQQRAYDLSIAAILGDRIYNFGELLLHPILLALKNTEYNWLLDLLYALNDGNVGAFESLSANDIPKLPILSNSLPFLRQKICLTALIETVFKRPSSNRVLTFDAIAKETRLATNEVEHLVMKALSLGLLKGSIDQVAQTVSVTWLQPRVLNMENIDSMRRRLDQWHSDLNDMSLWMETSGTQLWTCA